jgi:transcriptional regulator with XRE-family HTH domain
MENELQELFSLAAKYFYKQYKSKGGGSQGELAKQLGITQSYLSSVINGSRSASLDLQSEIAKILFGPYDLFLEAGRRIKDGQEPVKREKKAIDDGVESLIAKLTYYVMDHKRMAEELEKTKDFYETIVENQQTGVMVMDANHQVFYANNYMGKLAGISSEFIKKTTPFNANEKISGLDISCFREKYEEAYKTLEPLSYKNIQTEMPGERTIYISGWMIPQVKDSKFDGMICTLWDTTTSHILRNLLTLSFDYTPYGIGIVQQTKPGESPSIYYMNKEMKKIFGMEDIDPSIVPFAEILEGMKNKMANGDEFLKFSLENIKLNRPGTKFVKILISNLLF